MAAIIIPQNRYAYTLNAPSSIPTIAGSAKIPAPTVIFTMLSDKPNTSTTRFNPLSLFDLFIVDLSVVDCV